MVFKVLHILLAFNLFISSMGISVFEHICQKNGTTISFFVKSGDCCSPKRSAYCSAKKVKSCEGNHQYNKGTSFSKKPCCNDKVSYNKLNVTATNNIKVENEVLHPISFDKSEVLPVSASIACTCDQNTLKAFHYKPPPLYPNNIRVLYQSFLC